MRTVLNKWLTSPVKSYTDTYGLTSKPIVYEVGSRDGKDGVELAQRIYEGDDLWNDATIVLFECNPPQQEVIRSEYPKATLITEAISDKKGEVEFLQIHGDNNMVGSSSMNLNRIKESWVKDTTTIKVPTRRLDSVIEELGHQHVDIDIMKIDIEHFTYEALISLGNYLRNVKVFHLETEIERVARNKSNFDIALFMEANGYICTALENEWGEEIQDQTWRRINL